MKPQLHDLGPYRGTVSGSNQLLILNESFYLETRDKEIDPETWYAQGTQLLQDGELDYVNYARIFSANKCPDGRWSQPGCAIYRSLESALKDAGLPEIRNMLDYCTLANCFLRPAHKGASLQVKPKDIEVSKEYVTELVQELKPRVLICASSKAYHCVVRHLSLPCPVVKVSHPACVWWNRDGGKHGRRKFIDAVKEHR